ncbi:hypothetical protein [Leptospira interrogans]|uniref:Lipoprotein n=1 Tax=Leptospira interrogans serovar Bataviae TaxID=312175 RepID=A0AAQ0B1K9_LEPIR|nr:hypothetical protein [Leptospira interrogans]EMN70282.1 putative lipoprotein [Leptospira interrogans serovar Bataviae str. UI 08561]KAA1290273.1 hypothetical protein C4X99_07565 [Leptospira interrogans serovar Geyaweera]EKR27626.1 putative lipoprotein [Leptospira interrogans serovar Bataviae str. L1111]MCR8639223.1 hypothetical protein [Leptospira interrogans serovar Ricardi]QOI49521.1 hypothetical protein Lepto1489_02915 [Leptospira interrogans serovar Bataviae]
MRQRMNRLFLAIGIGIVSGCISIPVGVNLSEPKTQAKPLPSTVYIEKIILPSNLENRLEKEEKLTLSVIDYALKSDYFKKVKYIGQKSPSDRNYHVLQISCDEYSERREPHLAYFPLAILTVTLYIWFGGPIHTDTSKYSCELNVQDSKQKIVFSDKKAISNEKNSNLYDSRRYFPSSIEDRTEVIGGLLLNVYNYLKEKH